MSEECKRLVSRSQVALADLQQAWSKHKHLCKVYQNTAKGELMPDESTFCGTCGKSGGPLTKTECCGRTICDDEHLYVRNSSVTLFRLRPSSRSDFVTLHHLLRDQLIFVVNSKLHRNRSRIQK